jgi:hypothetical protein
LLLEQLISTKLEGALKEVSGGGRTEASEEGTGTFFLDDLSDATEEALVVCGGVELDSCLDAVMNLSDGLPASCCGIYQ